MKKLDGGDAYADLASRPRPPRGTACRGSTPALVTLLGAREAPLEYHDLRRSSSVTSVRSARTASSRTTPAVRRLPGRAAGVRRLPGGAKLVYPVPRDGFRDGFTVKFTVTKLSTRRGHLAPQRQGGEPAKLGLLSGGRHTVRWAPGKARPGFYTIGFAGADVAGNFGSVTEPRAYEIARDRRRRPSSASATPAASCAGS